MPGILYEHVKSSHPNFQLLFVLVSFGGNFPENSEKSISGYGGYDFVNDRDLCEGCEKELRMKGRGLMVKVTRK